MRSFISHFTEADYREDIAATETLKAQAAAWLESRPEIPWRESA